MWNFIKKLFPSATPNEPDFRKTRTEMTFDQFLNEEPVKHTLKALQRQAILLKPRKTSSNTNVKSKMGGEPNLTHFDAYPACDSCQTPLNFVLQLDKEDFPEFYWPGNQTIFQLFRCPNFDCAGAFSDKYDLKMFHFYFPHIHDTEKHFPKPPVQISNREAEVPPCLFHRESVSDYPMFESANYQEYEELELNYSDELISEFEEKYLTIQCTKILGYPSFTQNSFYPTCTCGKEKEFFFQLSSEDNDGNVDSKDFRGDSAWSHHGIMIGDVGNIYYFVCKACGEQTIESYWDCC